MFENMVLRKMSEPEREEDGEKSIMRSSLICIPL
jgi:hypothetical protein